MDIHNLPVLFAAQQKAFSRQAPDYNTRLEALKKLRDNIRRREHDLITAVSEDFGGRSSDETSLLELFPLYDQIRHARKHLRSWMRKKYVNSSWFLRPSRAFYQYQAVGVVGIIGAWNYQLLLTLGPLVDAISAGNHVMLKPSEITPRSAAIIATLITETFDPEYITCVTGGPEVAKAFSSLAFDHLFFTGSTNVGKMVMQSAAINLTPVTLELGGKSPAIIHERYPLRRAVNRIMVSKLFNAGQTCVAPDYVLLPAHLEHSFEEEAIAQVSTLYPKPAENSDYTRIVNASHYQRLSAMVADARNKGARVVHLTKANETGTLQNKIFPPTLIFSPASNMLAMQHEIFGPVLPVVTYKTIDDAISFVNAHPKPLALYYFDNDPGRIDQVVQRTMSGGVTINDCVYHLGQHNLPFGGVGQSGMGQYHGFDGFVTFSKKRGVMVQSRWAPTSFLQPPYTTRTQKLIQFLLKIALR
jgi:coniferyl-aldehyde dehydrogenase